jgi:cytoplasmic iron level regulating protein YaaA (DUF328/UPF0246 family)
MTMKLILIACCSDKEPGGTTGYHWSKRLEETLGVKYYRVLMKARRELAKILEMEPGPDLGFYDSPTRVQFLPAYKRYTGIMYRRSHLKETLPKLKQVQVVIISSLYGMVDAYDEIRKYNMAMDDTLPTGQKINTWWKEHELGLILRNYIYSKNPLIVHDLLSESYRKSVKSWSDDIKIHQYCAYQYPGEGTGSLYHRGDDLRALLEDC